MRALKAQRGIVGVITEVKTWPENIHDSKPYLCLVVSETPLNGTVQSLVLSGVKPLKLIKVKCIWREKKEKKLCKP